MTKPEVSQSNWEEDYKYYSEHTGNKVALHTAHGISALIYHPKVAYAEGAKQKIRRLLKNKTRLVIVPNHTHWADPFKMGSVMQTGPIRGVIGNTVTLAKKQYFEKPASRALFDVLGAVPVWRSQDIDGDISPRDHARMSRGLFNAVADRVEAGQSVLMFPEGTRNITNPRELGRVKSGVGHVVLACMQRQVTVAVVPVAMWRDEERLGSRPGVAVDMPLDDLCGKSASEITTLTGEGMARALLSAQGMAAQDSDRSFNPL